MCQKMPNHNMNDVIPLPGIHTWQVSDSKAKYLALPSSQSHKKGERGRGVEEAGPSSSTSTFGGRSHTAQVNKHCRAGLLLLLVHQGEIPQGSKVVRGGGGHFHVYYFIFTPGGLFRPAAVVKGRFGRFKGLVSLVNFGLMYWSQVRPAPLFLSSEDSAC